MTVSYSSKVSTSSYFGCFLKLLFRWRASVYKLVWPELCIYIFLHYFFHLMYRFVLKESDKFLFENIVKYCEHYGNLIPLSFVLGFYVNMVALRWWNQYQSIPFPDNLALLIGAIIKGDDDHGRIVRRTIMRYICLAFALTCAVISPKTKERFQTYDDFIEAGLLEEDEKRLMNDLDKKCPINSRKYVWLPLTWAANIVMRSKEEGMIRDEYSITVILAEINIFRAKCGALLDYHWISIPLVYTQVVTLAVYSYFLTTLFGRQWIEPHFKSNVDLYVPTLAILEFFFYMGWLKVAETLINPFGDDDDDFEIASMVDRHLQVTYLIVDHTRKEYSELMREWFNKHRTKAAQHKNMNIFSTQHIKIEGFDRDTLSSNDTRRESNSTASPCPTSSLQRNENCSEKELSANGSNAEMFQNSEDVTQVSAETNKSNSDCTEFDKLCRFRQIFLQTKTIKAFKILNKYMDTAKN